MEIECPHCEMDIDINEEGEFWLDKHIPDGDFEMECRGCGFNFHIVCCWTPNFAAMTAEEFGNKI